MEITSKTFWLNYLRPNSYVKSIEDIDFSLLYNSGIRVIICDLDNTLVPAFKKWPFKSTINLIKKIKDLGIKFYLVSNNSKSRVQEFVKKLETEVKIDGYLSSTFKPFLFKMKSFVKKNHIDESETIIIGDQFVTDILIANRLHMESVLVLSIIDTSEQGFINHILYLIEKFIYKKLAHNKFFTFQENSKNEEIELL